MRRAVFRRRVHQVRRRVIVPGAPEVVEAATGVSQGSARAVAALTSTDSVSGDSQAASRAVAALSSADSIEGTSQAAARALGTLSRTTEADGVSQGASRAVAVLTSTDGVEATSQASARAVATLTSTDSVSGVSQGAARAQAVVTSADQVAGAARGGARAVGVLTEFAGEQATAVSRGAARALAVATGTSTLGGVARGGARAVAVLSSTAAVAGVSRGASRTVGLLTDLVVEEAATGAARGGARAVGLLTSTVTCLAGDPTDLDDRLLPTALRILQKLGRSVTFETPGTKTYDPATGATTFSGVQAFSGQASPPLSFERKYVDGDIVRRGDARLILANQDLQFTPTLAHVVQFDGTEWQTVRVDPLYSGEQIAAWVLQIRGGGLPTSTTSTTDLDTRLPARALAILQRLGRTVTILTNSDSYSAATGANTITQTSYSVTASPPLALSDYYVDGDNARRGDAEIILGQSGLLFDVADAREVHFDSTEWRIVNHRPIYSGGLVAAWALQIRGGGIPSVVGTTVQNDLDRRLPARVESLLARLGKKAKFTAFSVRTYGTGTGETTERGACEFCEKIVLVQNNRRFREQEIDERSGTTAFLRANNLRFVPYTGMDVEYDGEDWQLIRVRPVYSGGKVAVWELGMAK